MKKHPTEKSLLPSIKSCNCYFSSTVEKKLSDKPHLEAIERYKKLCSKTFANPQNNFINTLKGENFIIFLDNYNYRDIHNIQKIIGSFFYFKQIILAPSDFRSCSCGNEKSHLHVKKSPANNQNRLNTHEKIIEEKERRDKENEKNAKVYTIIQGIAKNLCLSEVVKSFKICNIELKPELSEFLSEGLIINKSLKNLTINNCLFLFDSFEKLAKGLLEQTTIEHLDFTNNSLDDKCGSMLSRIIIRQTQRRDQVIWMHGLRNEKPLNNDFIFSGLISINLSNNNISDSSADEISNAISYDSYIRSLDLSNNKISTDACKTFIKVLRKNLTILNLDLRGNSGYNLESNLHRRIVVKLAKNIKHLHKQFMDGDFNETEYYYLKKFVNQEFFNVEVPQHIIEMYSASNSNSNTEIKPNIDDNSREVKLKGKYVEGHSNAKRKNKDSREKNSNLQNSDDYDENIDNDDEDDAKIQISEDRDMYPLDEAESEQHDRFYTDDDVDCLKTKSNHRYYKQMNKLKQQNQNLFHENLQLRKKLLEMRAQLLQNTANRGLSEANSANNNQLNNNSNNMAFYPEDVNNPITQNLSLTNNNFNISNNQKVPPVTGEEGSYENCYNRIENLFSELTRLMDNMENNIRRIDN